jgi:two-component system, OmpR family, KDP operon response regulator KdpE
MNNATILVVDDEPQIRRVLQATLFRAGYDVVEAKSGQESIERVLREHPDLILMDFNLPDMNGPEACHKIRSSFAGPIIMVTVRNSERDKIEALDSGADDYVGRTAGTRSSCAQTFQYRTAASENRDSRIDRRSRKKSC